MKKWVLLLREKWYFVCAVLLVLWMAFMGFYLNASGKVKTFQAEVGLLKQELSILKSQEVELQERVEELQGTINALTTERDELKTQIEQLEERLKEQAKTQPSYSLTNLEADLGELLRRIETLGMVASGVPLYLLEDPNQAILDNVVSDAHAKTGLQVSLVSEAEDESQFEKRMVEREVLSLRESFKGLAQLVDEWDLGGREFAHRYLLIGRPKHYMVYIDSILEQIDIILNYLPYIKPPSTHHAA